MELVIGLAVFYLIGMPVVFRLIALLHKKLITDKKIAKAGNNKNAIAQVPSPIWYTWKERLNFLFKEDKRVFTLKKGKAPKNGITNKKLFLIVWAVGLIVMIAASLTKIWALIAVSVLIFFIDVFVGMAVAKPVVEARKKVLTRMFDIARTKLGQSAEYASHPEKIIRVLEWEDQIKPRKVQFDVPDSFNGELGEDSFMKQYNQIFGQETTWVPSSDPGTGRPGWDYEQGVVTIHAVPPLPKLAKWDEHYVINDAIAWSFFPIALGVENGVELTNPETGEKENVLGFDVAGEQAGLGKKMGVPVAPSIVTAPMVLVGGGTGGGKSIALDEKVLVRRKRENAGI